MVSADLRELEYFDQMEQNRQIIVTELIKLGFGQERIRALMFTNPDWQRIQNFDMAIEALDDPTLHCFVEDYQAIDGCMICRQGRSQHKSQFEGMPLVV